ncbi:Uncaracterized surface protein containing fasciclin (FAS1) repeats [Salegentibacter holothuriorum]|uniref:Uncaracterized surface protein containing fasciclin (FAS1) repeats n=1 Tax=Salegentibacter holothuriorum TaxID=241145 RepID=A0A1T5D5F4_9FLAO|nr:fasciclin domain-containing protein [Salegentibacter holothuriorum]SKB66856.1 Uncaracterized surface protein containing fasciclin (FAS1) repeats [Salegentibacter holothuriorum]
MKSKILLILLAAFAFSFTSCEDTKKKEEEKAQMEQEEAEREAEMQAEKERMEMESNSIAAKAMATDSLSTLVSALKNAELATTFTEDEGPYTVFAPTNSAFEKVDKATLDELMKSENKDQLAGVLKYHVVDKEITASDLSKMIEDGDGEVTFATMEGAELTAMMDGENIVLKDGNGNTATIIATDIEASNGMVHLIDGVVMKKAS